MIKYLAIMLSLNVLELVISSDLMSYTYSFSDLKPYFDLTVVLIAGDLVGVWIFPDLTVS